MYFRCLLRTGRRISTAVRDTLLASKGWSSRASATGARWRLGANTPTLTLLTIGTLEYRIEDPGRLLFFPPNANRVFDLKPSRLLFFSKNVHRVAIKQSRLLDLLYSFFPKMYTESYIPSESFIFSSIFANRIVYFMRVLYSIL